MPGACVVTLSLRECQDGWAMELEDEASFLKPLLSLACSIGDAGVTVHSTAVCHQVEGDEPLTVLFQAF